MRQLLGHSIMNRIAVGPQAGRKVFTLQTLPDCDPAVSEKRPSLTPNGNIRHKLKMPWRDGMTHVMLLRASCTSPSALRASLRLFKIAADDFEQPLGFIARLTVLVPRPGVNLTRFHSVFVPNSQHRALVTPAKRGKGKRSKTSDEPECQTPAERHAAMTPDRFRCRLWAQRLKRVFNINMMTCTECGDCVKVIAGIEEPDVIKKILTQLKEKATSKQSIQLPESRALPQAGLFV